MEILLWFLHAMLTLPRALVLAFLLSFHPSQNLSEFAPGSPQASSIPEPVQMTAAQDHQRLLDLLHIIKLRPGVKHDLKADNPVNFDESKANPWPNLPNPLILNDGKSVTTAKLWWSKRRPEIVEDFDREVLGRVPANVPTVHWQVVSTIQSSDDGIATVTKHLIGHVDNSAYSAIEVNIDVSLTLPADVSKTVPVVLELTFENYPRPAGAAPAPPPPEKKPTWKHQVLAKGWGYALLQPTTIQPDNGAGLTQGIIGLCNHGQPRKLDDWGALRAWAWGGSRVMDYLETDRSVDAKHVAVEGHSRFGKAALVAMAYDQRFAVAYVSSSGAGGSALARRHFGEQLENVADIGEYHWMDGNYLKYAGPLTPADMPVDTHELIALCAPRPVFIGGGTVQGDGWADTRGSFIAEVAAGPVYRLLGKKGLETTSYPPIETALISGELGFRQHAEGHTPLPNWPTFITFASRYMASTPSIADRTRRSVSSH